MDHSAPNNTGTIERLIALFNHARSSVAAALQATGQPLTAGEQRVAVVPNKDGNGFQTETNLIATNVLNLMNRASFPEALQHWLEDARALAAQLAASLPDHIPMPLMFPGGGLDLVGLSHSDLAYDDPAQWTLAFIVLPATFSYLTSLHSVGSAEDTIAEGIAAEAIDILTTGQLVARQAIAICGVKPEHEFMECGRNRIRALTPLERGDLLNLHPLPRRGSYLGSVPDFFWPTHVLEMDRDAGRPNEIGMLPVPKLLLALQLHAITLSGSGGLATYLLPEWLWGGRMTRPLPMPRHSADTCALSQEQFDAACATADRLNAFRLDAPERPSELALHRFGLGCSRSDAADGVLDFVVALEALLLPYDREVRNADSSYRFRLHGALFIAEAAYQRRHVFRTLQKLYDMRSRLVHGDNYPDPAETAAASQEARQLAARALLKAVNNGFPDVAHFNRLALGETTS